MAVVALDAHDDWEEIAKLRRYQAALGLRIPVGLEETGTYQELTRAFEGINPFPVNVIVGKDGRIVYVAREYDAQTIHRIVERELARKPDQPD